MTTRTAIVTGGTRGIGRAIASMLRDAGCQVAVTYAGNEEAAKQCQDELGLSLIHI